MSLCECGCGQLAPIAPRDHDGYKKGQPKRFIKNHRARMRTAQSRSYPTISIEGRSLRLHRLRAERALGKPLPAHAQVHHADAATSPTSRLVICESVAYHRLLHARTDTLARGGDPNAQRWCGGCAQLKAFDAFGKGERCDGQMSQCRACIALKNRRAYARRCLREAS